MTFVWLLVLCACAMAQDNSKRNFHFGDRSYFLVDEPASWTDSLNICRASGAHLAVISCLAEAEDIKRIMTIYGIEYIHSGYHDRFTEGDYVTLDGETLSTLKEEFISWHPVYPRGSDKKNCGGFSQDGFTDIECSLLRPFICSFKRRTAVSYKPLTGYDYIAGHGYYKYSGIFQSWWGAERFCRRDGAHLIIINSQDEINAIKAQYYPSTSIFHFWTGVNRFFGGRCWEGC